MAELKDAAALAALQQKSGATARKAQINNDPSIAKFTKITVPLKDKRLSTEM